MTDILEYLPEDSGEIDIREADAQTKFLVLCGARWINHTDRAAASELIEALGSSNAAIVSLASTFLIEGSACA